MSDNDKASDEGRLSRERHIEAEGATTTWLSEDPDETALLYTQLFIPKQQSGEVVTPPGDPDRPSFISRLPPEIRTQVYEYYFDGQEEVGGGKAEPLLDKNGAEVQTIFLTSENVEFKFWLSLALLQTSRQVRCEAMATLFEKRAFVVDWLPLLPRFVGFLGKEGCAMVRYLDVWDDLNFQSDHRDGYRAIIKSISHLSRLRNLRIVLANGMAYPSIRVKNLNHRLCSWFDASDWTQDERVKEDALPKIRHEALRMYWPEFEVLKTLRTQKFTLAVGNFLRKEYVEFDRNSGVYPELAHFIETHPPPKDSASPMSIEIPTSILPEFMEDFEIANKSNSGTVPTWQDTDTLSNKTIPLYNFFREVFHKHLLSQLPEENLRGMTLHNFVYFPTALKSTGSIIRDCPLCYLVECHCGYHSVPDQPPFQLSRVNKDANALQKAFENLSYLDLREATRAAVNHVSDSGNLDVITVKIVAVAVFYDHQGWNEPAFGGLKLFDTAVESGLVDEKQAKDQVRPWDMLYEDFYTRYGLGSKMRSSSVESSSVESSSVGDAQ